MKADRGDVILVGSVAIPQDALDAAGVLGLCGPKLGGHVSMLPDGEVGDRYYWINYIARHTYYPHPDMVTLSRHTFEDWQPDGALGLKDHWRFTLRDGITELRFEKLGYADEAKKSYEAFTRLRQAGEIAPGTRFKVALPAPESGTRPFIDTAQNFEVLFDAYVDVVGREIDDICATIPHEDLAIQWDICLEAAAIEGVPLAFREEEITRHERNPLTRVAGVIAAVSARIPGDVWLGLHLCYGSLGHAEGGGLDEADPMLPHRGEQGRLGKTWRQGEDAMGGQQDDVRVRRLGIVQEMVVGKIGAQHGLGVGKPCGDGARFIGGLRQRAHTGQRALHFLAATV